MSESAMIRTIPATPPREESEHAWSLSFGDLMSLLLAVFVLIAAMSDLREGERFDSVSRSVRAAFGFTRAQPVEQVVDDGAIPPLLTRFETLGLTGHTPMLALDGPAEVAQCCAIREFDDQLVIQLAGEAVFAEHTAALQPVGQRVVEWVAACLREGGLPLEVRGVSSAAPLPEHATYVNGRDLAYARARQVADLLAASGVRESRLSVSTFGAGSPIAARGGDEAAPRLEIIVHALPTATHDNNIAGDMGS